MRDPLFIVSLGRSGSTVLHQLLCRHPRAAWLTGLCDRFPERPGLNALALRMLSIPGARSLLFRGPLLPCEPYRFWDHYCPGFSRPCRDLRSTDVTPRVRRRLREAFQRTTPDGQNRLIAKITGWPRLGFLREVFPEAGFVVIVRDGRAMISSALGKHWTEPWSGPESWAWGDLTSDERERWLASGKSFLVLAAIAWQHLTAAFDAATQEVPAKTLLRIRYEDLCADPAAIMRETVTFAGLEWTDRYASLVTGWGLQNQNHRWRDDLTPEQQRELEEHIGDDLAAQGYL